MDPNTYYNNRITELNAQLSVLQRKKSVFGLLRLGVIFLLILFFYFLWNIGWPYVLTAVIFFATVFLLLVKRHLANNEFLDHVKKLIEINQSELSFLEGNHSQSYNGDRFKPHVHDYAEDIDILGDYSLFQFVNRCQSQPGEKLLAHWLLYPAIKSEILSRQEAVKELAAHLPFLQNINALGRENKIEERTQQSGNDWLKEPVQFIGFKYWRLFRYLLPAIAISISVLYIFDYTGDGIFYGTLILMALIAYQVNKYVAPIHRHLSAIIEQAATIEKTIQAIENEKFNSALLVSLQDSLQQNELPATKNISHLKKILDRLDLRYNILISFFLNILLQWNLHQILDLEKWKTNNQGAFEKWFNTIANIEALSSMATLHFNFPAWVFPEVEDNYFTIAARELGHPFIMENKRVNNFLEIESANEITIITGSNMAGKSTYLRSVGVNLVLAQAGGPVCGSYFKFSPVQLMTSMRISDNLEESTSTFYAELKKLKNIIDKVNAGEAVFILLDEILRGTNSHDRHAGSEALIKQLIRQKAPAVIATHDIMLTGLQQAFPENITNFHFDVQVSGEELYFDYKLKPGICTSMNASILMKKIGIEI